MLASTQKAETQAELEPDEISNLIEEVVDLAWQINIEVDSDDVQELLDFHNEKLVIDEFIEIHEQEQHFEELESLDPVQSEDRMTVGNLTEGLSLIDKELKFLENPYIGQRRAYFFNFSAS
ncbi:tigger transposable element-derived protein 1 [Trichonephila clavipes]|nr:tigger transposable element-derived protein 1 [Trichonephila clavipes]